MKKELLKIIIIFLITVGLVLWGLNYIFLNKNAPKSKAAGETISYIFDPASVSQASGDFVTSVKIKPSIDMAIRGYQFEITFDKSKIQFKSIQYKTGVVSAGLGDDDSKAAVINQNGVIKVVGEIQAASGQVIVASQNTEIVAVTFTANSSQSSAITTGLIEGLTDAAKFFMIKPDYSLSEVPSAGQASFAVNGGGPTLTPTPTSGAIGNGNAQLNFKLKFQGIAKKPKDEFNKLKVKITIIGPGFNPSQPYFIDFTSDESGIWSGHLTVDKVYSGKELVYMLIKGPKHIQKRICDQNPIESYPGTYRCGKVSDNIILNDGENSLDFSNIYLLAGDLPEQDGIVNSYDTSLVYNNLGKKDAESIRLADVNLDGIVDTQDFSLIIAALSIRTDEGDNYNETVPTNTPTVSTNTPTVAPTITIGPTTRAATATPGPTITGPGASGDLLRDGSTYPVYTSVSFIGCQSVVSSVSSVTLSLLSQSQSYNNVALTYQITKPLLIGDISINDFLAQDLHKNDQQAYFGTSANISIQATGVNNYSSNLNNASFYSMSWCTSTQGCLGSSEPDLQGKKFIYIQSLGVCGL